MEKSIASCKAFDPEEGFYDTGDEFCKNQTGDDRTWRYEDYGYRGFFTKFEKSAFAKVMDTENLDMLITDRKPQKAVLKACEKGCICR